jgi:adenosine kinase
MNALICGSYAFDHIMVFEDQFKNHILPEQVHILNVSFLVPDMRKEFGGCAGNIAYNLQQIGGNCLPMATVGKDFQPYKTWAESCGLNMQHVTELADHYTAQAFITTDMDDNQITAFHPGAMNEAHQNRVMDATGITIGMVSPDGKQGMIDHARQFSEAGIPFVFDPGQGLPMFDGDELRTFLQQATWVAVNDYESQLLQDRTGLSISDISQQVEALIVTRGKEGSRIYTTDSVIEIPAVVADDVLDPTGCGDAYRAGLLYGLMAKLDWQTTGELAAVLGSIKVASHGTQNHALSRDAIDVVFKKAFNRSMCW